MTWIDTIVNSLVTIGTQDRIDLMGTWDTDESRGMTVARLIICITAVPNPIGGVLGVVQIHGGIGVYSQEAATAGVLPDPNQAADYPQRGWLWRCGYAVIDDPTPGYPVPLIQADVHAGRKLDTGEAWLSLATTAGHGTAFSVQFYGLVRMLVHLP